MNNINRLPGSGFNPSVTLGHIAQTSSEPASSTKETADLTHLKDWKSGAQFTGGTRSQSYVNSLAIASGLNEDVVRELGRELGEKMATELQT